MTTRQVHKRKLYLNVYDLQENSIGDKLGIGGAYHSGLQVDSTEYTFSQSGVFTHKPKAAGSLQGDTPGSMCKFKQSIYLGETTFSQHQIESTVSKLKAAGFQGSEYQVLSRNCNHFADAMAKHLLNSEKSVIPGWVNRSANFANKVGSLFGNSQLKKKVEVKQEWSTFKGKGRSMTNEPVEEPKKGWFSSWFGGSKKKATPPPPKEMTAEEIRRQRLERFG